MNTIDIVVVGAGIQGLFMAREAGKRGLKCLLLERARPGSGTTGNSFGLVHGGLRYLQTLSFRRWQRSRAEQAWYLQHYPDLAEPIACRMPLYKRAFRSQMTFGAAFAMESALLAATGMTSEVPRGRLVRSDEAFAIPHIPTEGLTGAAEWYDVALKDPQALIDRLVSEVEQLGVTVVAGANVEEVATEDGRVRAVKGHYADRSAPFAFDASKVVLCTGPWTSGLVKTLGPPSAKLDCNILAFNLLFDCPSPWPYGVAVSPTPGKGRSYFLRPYKGQFLAGTYYVQQRPAESATVSADAVQSFVRELDRALPAVGFGKMPVGQVMAGYLPSTGAGVGLRSDDVILDHSGKGARGLYSIVGVKLTTARSLAKTAAEQIWPGSPSSEDAPTLMTPAASAYKKVH